MIIKHSIKNSFVNLKSAPKNQTGAAAIEYAVIAALIVVVLVTAIQILDLTALESVFTDINAAFDRT